jgi:hypothetical protein
VSELNNCIFTKMIKAGKTAIFLDVLDNFKQVVRVTVSTPGKTPNTWVKKSVDIPFGAMHTFVECAYEAAEHTGKEPVEYAVTSNKHRQPRYLGDQALQDVEHVCEYLWDEEQQHYRESPTEQHVFHRLVRLLNTIGKIKASEEPVEDSRSAGC